MSDEQCGHPTTDGGECSNPTTPEGDPEHCWIPTHNDPDAENPHGRDFVIGTDDHDDILDAARLGVSRSGCARAAGTGPDQLNRYLEAHPDFREAFARARAVGEQRLIRAPLESHPGDEVEVDGQHARFLLSTSFDYIKTEKRELENTGDEPLSEIVVDFENVDT